MRRTNQEAKSLIGFIDEHVLNDHSSFDLQEIVDDLPENTDEAAGYFCNRLDLGNWFYEAMTLNEIDISAELINIGARKQLEEKETFDDQAAIESDLRRSQGWPV